MKTKTQLVTKHQLVERRPPVPRPWWTKTSAAAIALVVTVTTALAVVPPPDGGYANFNTAEGEDALFNLTTGYNNVAVGYNALYNDTTGAANTALGREALFINSIGASNTALGYSALHNNTVGGNTAVGSTALTSNSTGTLNTGSGYQVLHRNTSGSYNSGYGFRALYENESGSYNAAFGNSALYHNTGSNNTALGWQAGYNITTGSNNIEIGDPGLNTDTGTIRIGTQGTQTATYIAGIAGTPLAGMTVSINAVGQLGIKPSSQRYKDQVESMDQMSEALLSLRPVCFRYKKEIDPKQAREFGLLAEEVDKINPDLVVQDDKGKPFTVRYEAVNAMLLNEFLKEHRKVEEQGATIAQLKATLAEQQKDSAKIAQRQEQEIAELDKSLRKYISQLQKVSEQLATIQPSARFVSNK